MLATWVEREAAAMQAQALLLGFTTELYAPPDYCMVFWYNLYLAVYELLHWQSSSRLATDVQSNRICSGGLLICADCQMFTVV